MQLDLAIHPGLLSRTQPGTGDLLSRDQTRRIGFEKLALEGGEGLKNLSAKEGKVYSGTPRTTVLTSATGILKSRSGS